VSKLMCGYMYQGWMVTLGPSRHAYVNCYTKVGKVKDCQSVKWRDIKVGLWGDVMTMYMI